MRRYSVFAQSQFFLGGDIRLLIQQGFILEIGLTLVFVLDVVRDALTVFFLGIADPEPDAFAPRDQGVAEPNSELLYLNAEPFGAQEVAELVPEEHEAEPKGEYEKDAHGMKVG